METLTEKQKANRAYYAQNAEKITAKKRAQYAGSKPAKLVRTKKPSKNAITVKPGWQHSEPKKIKATTEEAAKLKARRHIEDLMLAKELGIDLLEL